MKPGNVQLDVIVIGGGPGGIAAAFWCADLGLSVVIIEQGGELGGQLLWTFGAIENYLGVEANDGRELRDLFVKQLESRTITVLSGFSAEAADLDACAVSLSDGRELSGRALVFATGVRRRTLDVTGEKEFIGKGVLLSGQKARGEVDGKRVVIVGGGDAAFENALILSETAAQVTVIHRRGRFPARQEFVAEAAGRANVEFLCDSTVSAVIGKERVQGVDVVGPEKKARRIDCEYVLIRIGVEPNVGLIKKEITLDERGYIRVKPDCSTNIEGVYAVGDVACPVSPTISTAVGMGATAAKAITARLAKDRA